MFSPKYRNLRTKGKLKMDLLINWSGKSSLGNSTIDSITLRSIYFLKILICNKLIIEYLLLNIGILSCV